MAMPTMPLTTAERTVLLTVDGKGKAAKAAIVAQMERDERRLARALLLSAGMARLRATRQRAFDNRQIELANRYGGKIARRMTRITDVLTRYYR